MLLNKEQIKEIIPYQEPFLFVDGVEEIEGNKIKGFYQTSTEDYYFQGHFVDLKIMPGVLVVEAIAQLSTILLRKKVGDNHKNFHFLAYDVKSCQFFRPIFPGERIDLEAEILAIYPLPNSENKIARLKGCAMAKEEVKVEVRFSVIIIKKEEFTQKYGKK